jgi:hypothetical protein
MAFRQVFGYIAQSVSHFFDRVHVMRENKASERIARRAASVATKRRDNLSALSTL